jgi:hypothetical protein
MESSIQQEGKQDWINRYALKLLSKKKMFDHLRSSKCFNQEDTRLSLELGAWSWEWINQ